MEFEANGPIQLFENEAFENTYFTFFFKNPKRDFTFFCFVAYVFSNNG